MKITQLGRWAIFALAFFPFPFLAAQSLPIAIDGQFGDWTSEAVSLEDAGGATTGIDFLRMAVTNDENYLFIRFEIDQEVVLTDGSDITLFIDGDNNQLTGKSINGIGAELELLLGDRDGIFYHGNSSWYHDLGDIGFHHLPTFGGKQFELAIRRDAKPDGIFSVFSGNKARIFFQNGTADDKMPNAGQVFTYTFNSTATPAYPPIDLQKNNPNHLRLMTWNTLADGMLDVVRKPSFQRVVAAINPDIITYNECWDMTAAQAKTFMNTAIPLGNGHTWNTVKLESGNITATRFPILQSWNIYPGHRLMASLIDLPDDHFEKDILVINGHLRCCDANSDRQLEADAFAKFILDAKSLGGVIDLPENTPFVLSGDMNLVGASQQYTTLVTGDIQNTTIYGNGEPLDWDGTDLKDVLALQADQRMAYTWHEMGSQYPPSRLDFHICSNSVLEVKKAFTLQTDIMPQSRLSSYGLLKNDNSMASDHLPKVTDFEVTPLTGTSVVNNTFVQLQIMPNPTNSVFQLSWENGIATQVDFSLKTLNGKLIQQWSKWIPNGRKFEEIDLSGQPNGVYFVTLQSDKGIFTQKILKLE